MLKFPGIDPMALLGVSCSLVVILPIYAAGCIGLNVVSKIACFVTVAAIVVGQWLCNYPEASRLCDGLGEA